MNLSEFHRKYVRIRDIYGGSFSGLASYGNYDFLECEYGGDEDGIFIENVLIYNSQIESIEEIEVHGTVEIWTENLTLRRYCMEDAEQLYMRLGTDPEQYKYIYGNSATTWVDINGDGLPDPEQYKYSGWNPFATQEMARETVRRFIDSYDDEHSYSWVIDIDDIVIGTIGAYDYRCGQIEVGFSICKAWQGRGVATEVLKEVLKYLTENEGISCVTAWCADENIGSRRVLEKSGMQFVRTEKDGVKVGDRVYDKLIYEYSFILSSRL